MTLSPDSTFLSIPGYGCVISRTFRVMSSRTSSCARIRYVFPFTDSDLIWLYYWKAVVGDIGLGCLPWSGFPKLPPGRPHPHSSTITDPLCIYSCIVVTSCRYTVDIFEWPLQLKCFCTHRHAKKAFRFMQSQHIVPKVTFREGLLSEPLPLCGWRLSQEVLCIWSVWMVISKHLTPVLNHWCAFFSCPHLREPRAHTP